MDYTCPDCGPAPVGHFEHYVAILTDWLLSPLAKIQLWLRRNIFAPIFLPMHLDQLALPIFKLLSALHLGTINTVADSKNSLRAKALWESAKNLGIQIYEFRPFGRALDTYVALYQNQAKFFYEMPRPNKALSEGFWWMDDKPAMRKHFQNSGIPVAIGGSCFRYETARKIFRSINGPIITKPSQGSRSRHTTVHIQNEQQLREAFLRAKKISPFVLVEQQLEGDVFRALVVGGQLAGVVSRTPPLVIGDGIQTVRMLIDRENKNPKRHNSEIFHEIPMNNETAKELQRQGLNLDSVPEPNRIVYVADKVSRGVGAVTVDLTDSVHPDNKELFEKIAKVVDDPIIGIDFIIKDITQSYNLQKLSGVIECNSSPFVDLHHYPYKGTARDVSAKLWQLIFGIPQPAQASGQRGA